MPEYPQLRAEAKQCRDKPVAEGNQAAQRAYELSAVQPCRPNSHVSCIKDDAVPQPARWVERFPLTAAKSKKRFVEQHLDPSDRLEEVLCGLIMVLDFTLIAGFTAGTGEQAVRHLLLAALGCNVAWGVIDGALYIMGSLTERRQRRHFLMRLRHAASELEAFSTLSGQLDPLLEPETSAEDRERISRVLLPVLSKFTCPRSVSPAKTSWARSPFSGSTSPQCSRR